METRINYIPDKVIQGPLGLYVFWIGSTSAIGYTGANLWRKGTGIKLFIRDGCY